MKAPFHAGRAAAWPWLLAVALAAAAFTMACRLATPEAGGEGPEGSVAGRFLVGSQSAISDSLYEEADVYFHRGIEHVHHKAAITDACQSLLVQISPALHVHAVGTDAREIIPWLRFATEVNPHNVIAYRLAAYTVASDLNRFDLAQSILIEAQRNNPRDYRIPLEWGHLYLREGDVPSATRALDLALRLWPSGLDAEDKEVMLDRAQALLYRAVVYLASTNKAAAIAAYAETVKFDPSQTDVEQRIREIETDPDPAGRGRAMLAVLRSGQGREHVRPEEEDEAEAEANAHDAGH